MECMPTTLIDFLQWDASMQSSAGSAGSCKCLHVACIHSQLCQQKTDIDYKVCAYVDCMTSKLDPSCAASCCTSDRHPCPQLQAVLSAQALKRHQHSVIVCHEITLALTQ